MYNVCFQTLQHYDALQFLNKKNNLKKKKKSRPTDPKIFSYVTGNKHIFLFGLMMRYVLFDKAHYILYLPNMMQLFLRVKSASLTIYTM